MKRALFFLSIFSALASCESQKRMQATGYAQGTTYSVIYYSNGADYQYQIDSLLLAFDRVLSTYQKSSYISRWNRNETDSEEQPLMFKEVVERAKEVHDATDGSFDITVSPLMNFWFERDWNTTKLDSTELDSIRAFVGMHQLVKEDGNLKKTDSNLQLDVNAIAQGSSVDVLSRYLESEGVFNYLVEIGGEIRASGSKQNDEPWTVGIDKPEGQNLNHQLILSLELENKAMATSGNYRKFVEINGQKFGHTLNAKTGYPAKTDVLSATIIADECMTADAFATGCMALGFERSKRLISEMSDLDGVLIYTDGKGTHTWISEGLKSSIVETQAQ